MKHTWEPGDIVPGTFIERQGIRYIIGYLIGAPRASPEHFTVIDLRDGAVWAQHTRGALASILTEGGYAPSEAVG